MDIVNFPAILAEDRLMHIADLKPDDLVIVGRYKEGIKKRGGAQYPNFAIPASEFVTAPGSVTPSLIDNVAVVDHTSGNDATAVLGRWDLPFQTINAAVTAIAADGTGMKIFLTPTTGALHTLSIDAMALLGAAGIDFDVILGQGATLKITHTQFGANNTFRVVGAGTLNLQNVDVQGFSVIDVNVDILVGNSGTPAVALFTSDGAVTMSIITTQRIITTLCPLINVSNTGHFDYLKIKTPLLTSTSVFGLIIIESITNDTVIKKVTIEIDTLKSVAQTLGIIYITGDTYTLADIKIGYVKHAPGVIVGGDVYAILAVFGTVNINADITGLTSGRGFIYVNDSVTGNAGNGVFTHTSGDITSTSTTLPVVDTAGPNVTFVQNQGASYHGAAGTVVNVGLTTFNPTVTNQDGSSDFFGLIANTDPAAVLPIGIWVGTTTCICRLHQTCLIYIAHVATGFSLDGIALSAFYVIGGAQSNIVTNAQPLPATVALLNVDPLYTAS